MKRILGVACVMSALLTMTMASGCASSSEDAAASESDVLACSGTTYIVQRGDTLSAIARRFDMPLSAVIASNPQIKDPNLIHVGQVIGVPKSSYLVEPGDNLTYISQQFGLSLAELLDANPQIKNPNLITLNQMINIPRAELCANSLLGNGITLENFQGNQDIKTIGAEVKEINKLARAATFTDGCEMTREKYVDATGAIRKLVRGSAGEGYANRFELFYDRSGTLLFVLSSYKWEYEGQGWQADSRIYFKGGKRLWEVNREVNVNGSAMPSGLLDKQPFFIPADSFPISKVELRDPAKAYEENKDLQDCGGE